MRTLHVTLTLTLILLLPSLARSDDSPTSPPPPPPPNFIFLMADDLGWGDVGFNGNRKIRTPHLDAMAAGGLRFERFYAASAVCSPTRASALTGRSPHRVGIPTANSGHLRAPEQTMAELVRAAGYRTGHFGKWHLGTLTKVGKDSNRGGERGVKHYAPPWEHGFDVCFSTEAKVPTWDPLLRPENPGGGKRWWEPVKDAKTALSYGTAYWDHHGKAITDNMRGDDSRVIMDRAIPFIAAAVNKKKPFFTVIWFHAPHLPVVAGPEHTAPYADEEPYARHYYGCITALDEQVGRLRKTLRELGVAKNTLVWFCSDNGPEGQKAKAPGSSGRFRGRKRSLYEGGIRVPALLEWPARIPKARSTVFPAFTSDYLPTVRAILGQAASDDRPLDGTSLVPVIEGPVSERAGSMAFQHGRQVALIGTRYKLYRKQPRRGQEGLTTELYDLLADPGETRDLAAEKPELVESMATTLTRWQASCARSREGKDYP